MTDRAHLETFLTALDATSRALRRDECGDCVITGKLGHIFADGSGFLIYISTAESPRRWGNVKGRLDFCRLAQDGDDDGCLHLGRLPTPAEAALIRVALGIRKRRHLSDHTKANALSALERARFSINRPLAA